MAGGRHSEESHFHEKLSLDESSSAEYESDCRSTTREV